MSLLTRKTDLKSLKYGQDRPGGGNSGQPYIQNNINNPGEILGFDDGLVRGGAVGAARASFKDTVRIGKWLKDFPKGPLWIVKQVGLQRSNPKLETAPGVGGLLGEPTRLYNLGINTLAQIPVGAFGIHFNRHGLAPVPIPGFADSYLKIAQTNNQNFGANNRLIKLKSQLIDSGASAPQSFVTKLLSKATTFLNSNLGLKLPTPGLTIYDYSGGPGSVYGVGRTLIRKFDNGRSPAYMDKYNFLRPRDIPALNYYKTLGVSKEYFDTVTLKEATFIGINDPTNPPSNLDRATYSRIIRNNIPLGGNTDLTDARTKNVTPVRNASYQTYQKIIESKKLRERTFVYQGNQVNAFGTYGDNVSKFYIGGEILPNSNEIPVYANGSSTDNIVVLKLPWSKITREERIGSGLKDQINLTPILDLPAGSIIDTQNGYNIRDLVKFRIQALNGNDPKKAQWMIFRAYVTQFSDSVDATWNPIKYVGRGEEFYIYNGFGRKVQIGFKVAALSAEEMKPMYQKLNFLMSNLMPDYSNGLMRGPMVKMTIGNWFDGQDGILNSLSYTVPNESPWEIAIDEPEGGNGRKLLILPHIIEVQMQFTPIGSQTKGVNKISKKSVATSHIAQNYNNETQYIDGKDPVDPPPPVDPDTATRANTQSTKLSPVSNGGTKVLKDGTTVAATPFKNGAGPIAPGSTSSTFFNPNNFRTTLGP